MSDKESELGLSFLREKGTNFPEKPRVVEDLTVFSMPDGLGLQFRGLPNPVVLKGDLVEKILADLLRALDGTRDVQQLFEQFRGRASTREIANLLMILYMRGLIAGAEESSTVASEPVGKRHLLFLGRRLGVTRHNSSAAHAAQKLAGARILLVAEGLLGLAAYDVLSRSGFENFTVATVEKESELRDLYWQLSEEKSVRLLEKVERQPNSVGLFLRKYAPAADLVIAVLRNAPGEVFDIVNEVCIQESVQWLRLYDDGSALSVGPYVNPHDSPCFECMMVRRISVDEHAVEEELYQQSLLSGQSSPGLIGESIAMSTLAASYMALEAVRIISGIEPPILSGQVLSFYSDGNIEQNAFTRVPHCEVCSRSAILSHPGQNHAGKIQ